ncbi:hypothetical protein L0F51_00300 [Afifella sp. H1R]|uniref:hypothetical protein n=1 Tax=Afifella sp. H1R TaxID=2908841 RepID=UPI001F1C3C7A|nr:hypothetical protein [Afifella sp. H1R]MCF1502205.1 hypothetical protein [Afifella sp. H1R]
MNAYGPTSAGFNRKPLSVILSEREQANVSTFGEGVIQAAATPLGQINGLAADFAGELWELLHEVYLSFDPDQVEKLRLDHIGRITGRPRGSGISDDDYRRILTNDGAANIKVTDALSAIQGVEGVSWCSMTENSGDYVRENGLPAHSLAFAVIGGADADVARAIYLNTVSGVGLYGLTSVEVAADGYCRQINFIRPDDVETFVDLTLRKIDGCGCTNAQPGDIAEAIEDYALTSCGFTNGMALSEGHVADALSSAGFGGLEMVTTLFGIDGADLSEGPLQFDIFSRPGIVRKNISVRFVT